MSPAVGMQKMLEALMKLARERWNDHHLAPPLRRIEVHSGEGRVLSRSEPTEENAE